MTDVLPQPALVAIAALLGLVLGSFLNVCIVRWGAEPKQSVVRPRSRCPRCQASLKPWDNVPVVSWLLLRGKCRNCGLPISPMYPMVEIATAVLWGGMVCWHGPTFEALRGAGFLTLLLGLALTDYRAYILPDEFTLGGLVLGLGLAAWAGVDPLITAIIGALVGFGTLWLVAWLGQKVFRKEAMGGGDIKMMAMVGAFLGWPGVFLTVFLGALLGTLVFLPLTLLGREKLVPFGIFLAMGAAVSWLVGADIITWYRGMAGF